MNKTLRFALGSSLLVPVALVARAETYLTEDQAVHLNFPTVKLARKEIGLTSEQVTAIEKASGETVRNKKVTVLVGPHKEALFIDQVLGKHEFITIAVAINPDKSVRGVEILEYRETYGYQVRNADWRKQFVGKNPASPLKLNSDIQNISGATLSSSHVTAGVRRLLHTYEALQSGF